ncbi:hypothetical protein IWX90DRAFT_476435 [Phyllosticta citrichinensis]|uniref:Uncharacterized protein n=1 Tax=Phyllosticta citrichinensis TaxID=1130410 RepID=A0ABR1Y0G8_9PEZI
MSTMKWGPQADAKLFVLILQLYQIKLGGENLARLNKAMGLNPKSQSISHRIGYLKKQADLPPAGASTNESVPPLTPRSRKKASPKKRKDSVVEDDPEYAEAKPESVEEMLSTDEHTPFYEGGTKTKRARSCSSPDQARNKFAKKLLGENDVIVKDEDEDAEFDPYDVLADIDLGV